jgi:hypothetical protein
MRGAAAIVGRAFAPLLAALLAFTVLAMAFGAATARAGPWMQVSCVNPDGSAAPNSGWSGFSAPNPGPFGAFTNTQCGPGSPMVATLGDEQPAPALFSEFLAYQPPLGSTLVGGTIDANVYADGYSASGGGDAVAGLTEPELANSPTDNFWSCEAQHMSCPGSPDGSSDFSGQIALPSNRGGNFTLQVGCLAAPGNTCNTNAPHGAWALAQIFWAHFLLSSNVAPEGSRFSGSALQPRARGTAHLVFTASDPGGPGVYQVSAQIDGRTVWSGVPNANGGACAPVGSDPSSGALMFDASQPCLTTEVVDMPVPTQGLPDGSHELAVSVGDAAQNGSTVLDQTITTSNPQTTPTPRGGGSVHARFVISWSWNGRHTLLRSIKVQKLTRSAHVAARCLGRGCPRLRVKSASSRRVGKLLRALGGKRFASGNRLRITVSAPHRRAERIELDIRNNRQPRARLLKR